MTHPAANILAIYRPWPSALLVLLACTAAFWIWLGHAGFGSTEGHRVIPAWEMLDSGEWWLPHLFERVYLRKPPGMPWAIAAFSTFFGRTEFAARAVSAAAATASALLALAFARRWFGPRAGLAAGFAQALMPVWLTFARSAEVESLHTLACQCAVFLTLDLGIRPRAFVLPRALALALAITAAGLVKGPAGAPVLLGALAAFPVALRSWRALARPAIWAGVGLGTAALAASYLTIKARLDASGLVPVLQDPSEFVPSLSRIPVILRLFPAALLQGLPITGAVALALWPQTRTRDAPRSAQLGVPDDAGTIAQALALTFLFSIALLMVSGVSNPRYALPALTPLAPLGGWTWAGRLGLFDGWRKRLATWTSFWSLWALPALALLFVGVYVFGFMEPRRAEVSGKVTGEALAATLPDGAILYADWLIEARPEILLYARTRAAALGKSVRVKWVDLDEFNPPSSEHAFLAVRDDANGNELRRPGVEALAQTWPRVFAGTANKGKYSFIVLERTQSPQ